MPKVFCCCPWRLTSQELGNEVPKGKPLLFLKPTTSYVRQGSPIVRPSPCQSLHHEVELGVIIGKGGKKISPKDALSHIAGLFFFIPSFSYLKGYTVALDMTARDLQDIEKKKGAPWTEGKCWDTFCAIGDFIPVNEITNPQTLDLWLKVNDTIKQKGNTNDMIFPYVSLHLNPTPLESLKSLPTSAPL